MYHQGKEKSFHNDKRVTSSKAHTFNIYAPNNRASKYKKQKLIEVEGDRSTIIVKSLKRLLSKLNGTSTQKISTYTKSEYRKI